MRTNPSASASIEAQEVAYQTYVTSHSGRIAGGVRTIPVVVHVIQCSDLVQLPDAVVHAQIDVLNEDYRRIAGSPGFGNGVDTDYSFCLASIDPDGCPTTGIHRIVAPNWCHHDVNDEDSLKALAQWDPRRYLNLWVPASITYPGGINEVTGYATFPTQLSVAPQSDGVVINAKYFGRNLPTNSLRNATHEIGHWMGLFHTFQNGCQGNTASTCTAQGDRVCDTPQADVPNFGCPSINSCIDSPVDPFDQVENYMDYSYTSCQHMFTQGQKDRIDFFCNSIRSQLWSPGNLTATGCDGTVAACAPSTDFEADKRVACVGESVRFTDLSGLSPTSWNWDFPGGTPFSATSPSPVVAYNLPGLYNVALTAGNAVGSNAVQKLAYIEVVEPSLALLQESFEDTLPLPLHWSVTDDSGIHTWELAIGAASDGQQSMKVQNYAAQNAGESMSLHSSPFSLQNVVSGYLTFDHSYRMDSGAVGDTLKVHLSTDCGTIWTEVWSRAGQDLETTADTSSTGEWLPLLPIDWTKDSIAIDSFAGEGNVKVRFEVRSAGSQSIYLDHINMDVLLVNAQTPSGMDWEFQLTPNPFCDQLRIDYTLLRPTAITFVLTDLSGKVLGQMRTERQGIGQHSMPLMEDVCRSLPAGLYLLEGRSDVARITKRMVKMH